MKSVVRFVRWIIEHFGGLDRGQYGMKWVVLVVASFRSSIRFDVLVLNLGVGDCCGHIADVVWPAIETGSDWRVCCGVLVYILYVRFVWGVREVWKVFHLGCEDVARDCVIGKITVLAFLVGLKKWNRRDFTRNLYFFTSRHIARKLKNFPWILNHFLIHFVDVLQFLWKIQPSFSLFDYFLVITNNFSDSNPKYTIFCASRTILKIWFLIIHYILLIFCHIFAQKTLSKEVLNMYTILPLKNLGKIPIRWKRSTKKKNEIDE